MTSRCRRGAIAVVVGLLLVAGAGCSDDEPDADDPPSPTITEPDRTITTEGPETSSETTVAGTAPDEGVLTVETATATIEELMAAYRDALQEVRAAGTLDERALRAFTAAYTAGAAQQSIDGLASRGGVDIIVPGAQVPSVSDVELVAASETCAEVTATVEGVSDLISVPIEVVQPYTARLVRAPEGAPAPAWRLDFFSFQPSGRPIPEGACP